MPDQEKTRVSQKLGTKCNLKLFQFNEITQLLLPKVEVISIHKTPFILMNILKNEKGNAPKDALRLKMILSK